MKWKGLDSSCHQKGLTKIVIYSALNQQVAIKEDTDCEPWTAVARYKLQVEHFLESVPDLNYVILRPALVYGLADKTGLSEWFQLWLTLNYNKMYNECSVYQECGSLRVRVECQSLRFNNDKITKNK